MQDPPAILFLIHSLAAAGSEDETAWAGGSFLASSRIQLDPARQAAIQLGWQPKALALRSENINCLDYIGSPKCCIVGKLSHPDAGFTKRILLANLAAISILKSKDIPVVVTYSDNLAYKDNGPTGTLYRTLLWHADGVVYPSKAMQQFGSKWINHKLPPHEWIIEDPWQVERQPYHPLIAGAPCRIIWFGHSSNAKYLFNVLPILLRDCQAWNSYELTILSDETTQQQAKKLFEANWRKKEWTIRLLSWDNKAQPEQLSAELQRSHIAILPSDPNDPRKSAASHNRAVDAIQAGCMVVCSPIKSYLELQKLLLPSSNFAETINACTRESARLAIKWAEHRNKVLEKFSPASNLHKWKAVIKELNSNHCQRDKISASAHASIV